MEITIADVISKSSEKIKRLMVQSFLYLFFRNQPSERNRFRQRPASNCCVNETGNVRVYRKLGDVINQH